jgi:hypothetical protein
LVQLRVDGGELEMVLVGDFLRGRRVAGGRLERRVLYLVDLRALEHFQLRLALDGVDGVLASFIVASVFTGRTVLVLLLLILQLLRRSGALKPSNKLVHRRRYFAAARRFLQLEYLVSSF